MKIKPLDSLYDVPFMLQQQGLDDIICKRFSFDTPQADLSAWSSYIKETENMNHVNIALIGKYVKLHDAYLSVIESLHHAAL